MKEFTKLEVTKIAFVTMLLLFVPHVRAQERMTDKDIENTMKNLKSDAQHFQLSFNSAISKSTIRKTSQEKEAKALVKSFRNQVETMSTVFHDKKKADGTLPGVMDTARKIDDLLARVTLGGNAVSEWSKCRSEVDILAKAFHM